VLPPFLDNLDIFHIQWAKTLVQYPEFIEKLTCPIVLSLRGTHINVSPISDEGFSLSYKKYFPRINGFHAVSQAIAEEAEKYGADINKITVINPAVDEKLLNYKADKVNNLDSEILHIISVGRCHWIKGYTFVLDAMSILRKEKVDFNYTIIAGGRDQENILYQIHDLGLNECVSFINDELSHDEVLKKVSECDLFLLPSLEEGISNAVIEAMALGLPVISTDCGGMGEVIRNSENGFLVPVRDSESMAKAIQNFIDLDEMEKNNMIFNARETIIHNHLLSYQVDQFKSFYSKIV
jgi:colanic acid/amylovoran biosynthesis glycosyltransferase